MNYNFVILRTEKGGVYAKKILSSVKWINKYKYPRHTFNTYSLTIDNFYDQIDLMGLTPENTIINPRCAYPYEKGWMKELRDLENRGFKVVNSVDAIKLTSNKLESSLLLQGKVSHPKSWEYNRNETEEEFENLIRDIDLQLDQPEFIIAKPLTSIEQGANVNKIEMMEDLWDGDDYDFPRLRKEFNKVPGERIVIQEFIPYTALHRVIVIDGKALPFTFVDKPEWKKNGDWKVSCCLNRTSMRLYQPEYLGHWVNHAQLFSLAEETQKLVKGKINFIDIFETKNGYTIGEINTACSLNIHERLAKKAGRKDWNIHYRIAKQLVKELLNV